MMNVVRTFGTQRAENYERIRHSKLDLIGAIYRLAIGADNIAARCVKKTPLNFIPQITPESESLPLEQV